MRCLGQILKIRWDDVREQRIRNLHVRKKFLNIETIENNISKRRLILFVKIIRMKCKCVPARLISAFQMEKIPLGRPNITVRHSFNSDIGKFISSVDPAGSFNSWARVVFDESRRTELGNNLESTKAEWDDSDRKDNEPEENLNEPEENLDWNKSPLLSPSSSRSFYNYSTTPSSPLSNIDISNHFESLGIAITSCLKTFKFKYRNLILIFYPDKCNNKKTFTEEEGSTKFKYVFKAYTSLIESNSIF